MTPKFCFYSLILFSVLMFSSCSDDQDDSIVGTYQITSFQSSMCSDPSENFTFDFSSSDGCAVQLGVEICGSGTLTLTESNTYSLTLTVSFAGDSDTLTSVGSYEVDGNTITICEDGSCESGTFDSGSGEIALRYADFSCVVTIRGKK